MAKITINGETFEYDRARTPLSEAIMVEKDLGCRYEQWQQDMQAGSARALAEFIRIVWLRNGRDIPLADIESGAVEVDLSSLNIEDDEVEEDPKSSSVPDGTPGTGDGTSPTSRKSSTSAPGKSTA